MVSRAPLWLSTGLLIVTLCNSCYGVYIGNVFSECIMYADDIALVSLNCRGLSKMLEICEAYGCKWDIQFNPQKTQLLTYYWW